MPETISFGTWLRQKRRALDLTQKAFADQIGCAEITVRRMEADEYKPSNELALLLFEQLGIPEAERPQWVRFARGLATYPIHQVISPPSRAQKTNLPIPLTSFIGREKDVERIQHRLAEHRLVTLIGVGGIGKTRLSQQVANQVIYNYAHGVWLVELAALNEPTLVLQSVAAVFGIQQGANDRALVETLVHFLYAKTILLILDNCEHLLDACAELADKLLKSCPNLKILATSREALGIIGEALYQVPSLTIPDIQQISLIEKLNDYESIRLFSERAQLVQMDFAVTKENASSVTQICSRLDGIPLAIELAAVRIQTLSAEQISEQLDQCFHILTGGSRTALPKHQTLQASIDWSWHLLDDSEQILLRRLSVFAGAFTLGAAEQVCAGEGIQSHQVLGLVTQLVAKSLVVENQASGREKRFRLLETIRQYAREKLVESGEEKNIRTQHLKYYLQLLEQAEPEFKTPAQIEWNARLHEERDNIRAALEWACTADIEAGLYISGRLARFWEDFDLREGEHWLRKLLELPESYTYPRARAKALYAYGIILHLTGQKVLLEKTAQECLRLHHASGDQAGEIDGLILLARFMWASNKIAQARELYQQALDLSESLGDVWRKAFVLAHLGWLGKDRTFYWTETIRLARKHGDLRLLQDTLGPMGYYKVLNGDIESAQRHLDEASQLSQASKLKRSMGHVLRALSMIENLKGNFEKSYALLEEDINTTSKLGHRTDYLWNRALLGCVLVQQGKLSEAYDIFVETVQEFVKDKDDFMVIFTLERMAGLSIATDNPERAARLIGWADAALKQMDGMRPPLEQADVDKIIAACLAKMGEAAFSDAYSEGQKMTLDEAVTYASEEAHE
ncbi:MAG: NB-ARC domain-containing protein [Anaerolineales bacterium]